MNIRVPQTGKAAKLARSYLQSQGLALSHQQALELVARLHGYQDWQAMQADARFEQAPALRPTASDEYELAAGQGSAWVGVDNISVYIRRNDEGVTVDLYPKGDEMAGSLAGTSLTFAEAAIDEPQPFEQPQDGSIIRAYLHKDATTGRWTWSLTRVDACSNQPPSVGAWLHVEDCMAALAEHLKDAPFTIDWECYAPVMKGPYQVFQDGGDFQRYVMPHEALNAARNMRDAGAEGTWTVETAEGLLIALFR